MPKKSYFGEPARFVGFNYFRIWHQFQYDIGTADTDDPDTVGTSTQPI